MIFCSMKSAQNGGFGRKERRPGCDRCDFWQGATHEVQMWLWPTLSRIWLASLLLKHWLLRLFLSARITLLLCCLLRRLPCVRFSMIGTFHFRAFKVFSPLFKGISVDGRCFCTTSPASIMVTFEKVERSPEEKTPLGLFHSLTSHGCPAPIS